MAKKTSRPGRTLLIFFISIGVLYGLAAIGGTWKPKLGLDLDGGTRITLVALNKQGLTATKLKQARDIIDARVNGNGVTEAEVTPQGNNQVVVEVPGKNATDLVAAVTGTAQLRFRVVATIGGSPAIAAPAPTVTPTATPTSSPTSTPTSSPSSTATPGAKASQNPGANRPAPSFDQADPTPTPQLTGLPLPVSSTSQGTPLVGKQTAKQALAWAANPDTTWVSAFEQYECPKAGAKAPVISDDPDQPLITCNKDREKFLLSSAVVEGTSLKSASAGIPQSQTVWAVNLTLKGSATSTFAEVSRSLYDSKGQFAIVLDGTVISNAGFEGIISNGSAQITGGFNQKSATALANSLKFGALPIRFDPEPRIEFVGPSLAGNQLSAGVLAGIIGLLIVMIYCLFYYRGLGLVVIASLVVAAVITYGTVLVLAQAAGFTLTLPGIAGLIVAVGITADSFIVYFERIRDEMRDGKSMRVAVEAGWVRARNTCLAADAVSLLAAVVLYIFAIGVVRGFAFALGISTLIDIVVFFWFTKPTVTLLAKRQFFNSGHRLSGLSPETLGIDGGPEYSQTRFVGGNA